MTTPHRQVQRVRRCTVCGGTWAAVVYVRNCTARDCAAECTGHPVCSDCAQAAVRRPGVTRVGLT